MRPASVPPNSGQPSALAMGAMLIGSITRIEIAGHVRLPTVPDREAC